MAVTVDWGNTFLVTIPQSELTLVTGTLYELNLDEFRFTLKALESSVQGMPWPEIHTHTTDRIVVGTTFAPFVLIEPPYSVVFQEEASLYSVRLTGANTNLFDVESGILQQNNVQVIPNNSAGLVVGDSSGGGAAAQQDIRDAMELTSTSGKQSIDDKLDKNYQIGVAGL